MENFLLAIAGWNALSSGATITGALINILKSAGEISEAASKLLGLL